jgi:hypothetical protein
MASTLTQRPRWEELDKSHLALTTAMEHYLTACRTEGKTANGGPEEAARVAEVGRNWRCRCS